MALGWLLNLDFAGGDGGDAPVATPQKPQMRNWRNVRYQTSPFGALLWILALWK